MRVNQPRTQKDEGMYFGCRAIRVVTEALFEWLGLDPMLHRERARASERLRRKAQKANRKLSEFMNRIRDKFRSPVGRAFQRLSPPCRRRAHGTPDSLEPEMERVCPPRDRFP